MPSYYRLPPIFHSFTKNIEATKYQSRPATNKKNIHSLSQKHKYFLGYFLIISITVFSTALFLSTTNLARAIMDASRERTSQQYYRYVHQQDKTSIRLTTNQGMVAIITDPDNLMSGDSAEGIRFGQINNSSVTQHNPAEPPSLISNLKRANWIVLIKTPKEGSYNIEFSAHYPGTYTYNLYLASWDGLETIRFSGSVSLDKSQRQRYILRYNHQNPEESVFVYKNSFYR